MGAGGDRDRGKRGPMGRAAAEHADIVFVTDDNPRSEDPGAIRAALLEGARSAGTGRGAARRRPPFRGDLAGGRSGPRSRAGQHRGRRRQGHETGQEIAGTIHPFDDREEVRKALQQLIGTHEVGA